MNINDVISRATHTSGRSLLAISGVLILTALFKIELHNLPIIASADNIKSEPLELAAAVMILYLLVVHFLNWRTDLITHQQGELISIYREQRRLILENKGQDWEGDEKESRGEHEAEPYDKLILKYTNATSLALDSQKVTLYGQHLAFPLIVGVLALIALMLNDINLVCM